MGKNESALHNGASSFKVQDKLIKAYIDLTLFKGTACLLQQCNF